MNITIDPTGEVSFIGALPIDLPLTGIKRTRVSHIVPVNPIKRAMFRTLRLIFGERGRVADYTRSWTGAWRATIIATGQTYTAPSRADAIAWELGILNPPLFDY